MADNLESEIRSIIAGIIEAPGDKIKPETDLAKELGADSMAALEIMAELEGKYGIVIEQEYLPEMATLGRMVCLVEKLKSGK
ncbi:MAG: acyl carrier protein [Verrucomicrobiae bacterium]|nr:acyl carrier protein [Verrucomicrobiae bacterium]